MTAAAPRTRRTSAAAATAAWRNALKRRSHNAQRAAAASLYGSATQGGGARAYHPSTRPLRGPLRSRLPTENPCHETWELDQVARSDAITLLKGTRCVTHKSPPPHFIIYTYMAETLLLTAGDDGEAEERTPKHVHAAAWVDTTHSITNAAALSTTEDVETTRASGSLSNYTGIVGELLAAFLELRDRLNIQATISSVPTHAGIDGNELAHSEALAAIRQMSSTPSAFRNSVGDALRPVPLMPIDIPRRNETLVRRLVTKTVLSPALRHKFFSDDPDEGKCRRCRRTAAAAHVVWECQRHDRLRITKLEETPDGIRLATYFDWILPTSRDKALVTLLWTKLAEIVYDNNHPGRRLCSSRRRSAQHQPRPP
ncbi:hypothetical protein HPB47_027820 [Ixodes persulcatus]|uniref:Uncharacterized protein n=1 Tax=Ixodes persulcatus TaxID=34615 RepID=A0AC60PVF1_IXOPE|nr:hypothetical protein HPB47_027820 [Ixodes persulcatus]